MRGLSQVALRYGPRLTVAGVILVMGTFFGCGGSAGVGNGTVVGRVFSDASSASRAKTPLAGVAVVARRQAGAPLTVRRVLTDSNGQYIFTDVFTGPYQLGFSREGFIPIDSQLAISATGTNLSALDVFVESDSTSVIPDVTMATNRQAGSGTLVVTVLDLVTGDAVSHATVTAGAAVTSNGGNNGVYTLEVPLLPVDDSSGGTPFNDTARALSVQADGYQEVRFESLGLVANETVTKTVFLAPLVVSIDGVIRVSSFFKADEILDISQVNITVENALPEVLIQPNTEGEFTIRGVPASNSNLTRTFNLRFTHPNLNTVVVSNVVAPRAGNRSIPLVVTMSFITVDVTGTVVDALGFFPPTGIVVVEETGQEAAIVNGTFTIGGVPVQQAPGDTALTFRACALTIAGTPAGVVFTARPTSDGSPNPIFSLGLATVAGACGS